MTPTARFGIGDALTRLARLGDADPAPTATADACLKACAFDHGTAVRAIAHGVLPTVEHADDQALPTVTDDGSANQCRCYGVDLLAPWYDRHWYFSHHSDLTQPIASAEATFYRARVCPNVRDAGSGRSMVYAKDAGSFCPGTPVGSGMVIDSGSVLESVDPANDLLASDLRCQARCDNDTRCATAHVFVESFALHQLAHAKPPPPSPPAPPSPPPPQDPPLAPFPPLLPPAAKSGYRLWSPAGWEPPLYDPVQRMYTLTCGLLTGDFKGTIYASKSQAAANTLARRLIDEGTYTCLLYTSPSPRDRTRSRMPSSA